jgi:predicted glycoside hydrolase/deacetylase ChbG (UPF0249 family)
MTAWLVVNADDLGVSVGATMGVIRAHREGIVTSASLAVTTAHYQHAVDSCVRACPELGIGLHFTLTSGTPASEPGTVPTLVGRNGKFRHRFMSLWGSALAAGNTRLFADIAAELEAQLARLRNDGIRPDHINGERHVHLIPGIFEIVAGAAKRHGVRYVRAGRDAGSRYYSPMHAAGVISSGGFIKSALLATLSRRARGHIPEGVTTPDYVASYLHTGRLDMVLPELLRRANEGVTEVMVHPGVPGANTDLALGNSELESYLMSDDRRAELDACISALGATGEWTLTNYRQLAAAAA